MDGEWEEALPESNIWMQATKQMCSLAGDWPKTNSKRKGKMTIA